MQPQNKLFIGSLPWAVKSEDLKALFEKYGEVTDAAVIMDRDTGRSKGFGFVTFKDDAAAKAALEMDGKEVQGRTIFVSIAKPREERSNNGGSNKSW